MICLSALLFSLLPLGPLAAQDDVSDIHWPAVSYRLDNGLLVTLHQDRTLPRVVVNVTTPLKTNTLVRGFDIVLASFSVRS